jgi:hypothetical protein
MNRRLVVLAAALGLAVPGVREASATGEVVFGAQNWWQTVNEAKYQEFREKPNGAFVESFLVRGAIGGTAITGWGSDLFLRQQALGASVDRGIKWQLDGSYSQLPHLFSQNARSPFTNVGGGTSSIRNHAIGTSSASPMEARQVSDGDALSFSICDR